MRSGKNHVNMASKSKKKMMEPQLTQTKWKSRNIQARYIIGFRKFSEL